jgi:hypothetical protein
MNKEMHIVRGISGESYTDFGKRILDLGLKLAENNNFQKIKITYTAEPSHFRSIIPFRKTKIAAISIYREDKNPFESLMKTEGHIGAYRVTEALPVKYEKTWPDREMTPGICLLTLFNRKKGIDYETFIHRWHNSHTPLSLKIHPLWNYSRNVVDERITANATPYEGIVEEQMRTDADLLNPFRFFGNPLVIIPRMIAVYRDTKSFLDYGNIETYMAREVVVKS